VETALLRLVAFLWLLCCSNRTGRQGPENSTLRLGCTSVRFPSPSLTKTLLCTRAVPQHRKSTKMTDSSVDSDRCQPARVQLIIRRGFATEGTRAHEIRVVACVPKPLSSRGGEIRLKRPKYRGTIRALKAVPSVPSGSQCVLSLRLTL
jgi:hypothetical protein